MRYKSCHLIEHGISIDIESIKACCLSHNFNKGQLMVLEHYEKNKIDWDKLFEIKHTQRLMQQSKCLEACEGCYNLREEDWDEDDYISYINFDHWSECNSDCLYCGVRECKPKTKNNVLNAMKELFRQNKFRNGGEITFQGGEPTILREFEPLLNLFLKFGCKVRIHSSGILFSRAIRDGLKKGQVCVVVSPDAARKETYKRVKNVDKMGKVYDNIKHYRKDLPVDYQNSVRVKYIIIPGVNDTFEEVQEFLDKLKELDIKYVIVDFEYTYANRNINNVSPHVYILSDYIRNFAKENGMEFDFYDSAKYAEQNRTFPVVENFDAAKIKELVEKYKAENISKNISYKR